MKKIIILSLALTSVLIVGCNQPASQPTPAKQVVVTNTIVVTNQPDIHPAGLAGNWKAQYATKATVTTFLSSSKMSADVVVSISTGTNGTASFQGVTTIQGTKIQPQVETISGTWKQADDYWIIEKPNGGFVAFRISSQTQNQLTVFSRTGQTIQFNRIP